MEKRFIPDEVLSYCEDLSSSLPKEAIKILEKHALDINAHMMLGKTIGNLIRFLILIQHPKRVLEIGSYFGFTTAILASSVDKDSIVTSLEEDKDTFIKAKLNLNNFINIGKLELINKEGLAYLETVDNLFDMILIDARKECFFDKINSIYQKLRPQGLLIVDNTLAGLNVLAPYKPWHKQTIFFNNQILRDGRFLNVQLPIRDGLAVCIKIR